MGEKRFALLIDSDNVSSKYIDGILDELTEYGEATYRRIYGDFTNQRNAKWSELLLEKSITPIQQFSNTSGKNATDSALIIDAMDLLYTNNMDGFCIVSSDSDFTRLASRLRESGKTVIGMGERKTPSSFRAACTVFTELENLLTADEEKVISTKDSIQKDIINIITKNENSGKITGLGEIGSKLQIKYPDFDIRNYGYSQLSKFLADMPQLVVDKTISGFTVSLKEQEDSENTVIHDIRKIVERNGKKGIALVTLGQEIRKVHPNFNVKVYGYSQLYRFVGSIPGLVLKGEKANRKVVAKDVS
ncbi:MAG: NYN domain-containing protein [Lachnospiraceae bacterium]|nr:NYN domain-containing protein [Lachnospiraceae bacterium]